MTKSFFTTRQLVRSTRIDQNVLDAAMHVYKELPYGTMRAIKLTSDKQWSGVSIVNKDTSVLIISENHLKDPFSLAIEFFMAGNSINEQNCKLVNNLKVKVRGVSNKKVSTDKFNSFQFSLKNELYCVFVGQYIDLRIAKPIEKSIKKPMERPITTFNNTNDIYSPDNVEKYFMSYSCKFNGVFNAYMKNVTDTGLNDVLGKMIDFLIKNATFKGAIDPKIKSMVNGRGNINGLFRLAQTLMINPSDILKAAESIVIRNNAVEQIKKQTIS